MKPKVGSAFTVGAVATTAVTTATTVTTTTTVITDRYGYGYGYGYGYSAPSYAAPSYAAPAYSCPQPVSYAPPTMPDLLRAAASAALPDLPSAGVLIGC